MSECRVCGNVHNNARYIFQEKYFGIGDEFDYLECGACKSLSIMVIPQNMERYYPHDYYSYAIRPYTRLSGFLKCKRDRYYLDGSSWMGCILSYLFPVPPYIEWLHNLALPIGSSILDVGSGGGSLIVNLRDAGFSATGIDSYIGRPIIHPNGAKVLQQSLEETSGTYDCIMLHHCLEHMAEPSVSLGHIARLLNPGGKVLIRVPMANTHAWKTYKGNWFQLDAPRHFVIYSHKGLCELAAKSGFKTDKIVYDSTGKQFWASEQYAHGIALMSEKSYGVNPANSMVTSEQLEGYAKEAALLNERRDGDQAAFYFINIG